MEKKNWGKAYKIVPWKEFLTRNTILEIPLPQRDPEDISFDGIQDSSSKKIGYVEGRLKNGYPFRLECAQYNGFKVISVFVSTMGLVGVTGEELDEYLREQELYEVYDTKPAIYTYVDKKNNEFWRIDVLLESDGNIFSSSPLSIEEFSYGHTPHDFRVILDDGSNLFKVYYNEDHDIVEYAVCSKIDDIFNQKFRCCVLSTLEMQKLNTVMALGKSDRDIIKLMQDFFALSDMEDLLNLLEEYTIGYFIRDEY